MQRVRGEAQVVLGRGGLGDLRQQGSAKAMLPRVDGDVPEVVFLNTAGGVTGGDRLEYGLTVGPGALAVGATQTAERAYRASGGTGLVRTRLTVGAGARLDWLPQEVIVFDGAALRRETDVELGAGAAFLGVESVVLGRAAHGETVRHLAFEDIRTIRRQGRPIHQEHLVLDGATLLDRQALGAHRAFATLVWIDPEAEAALDRLRGALGPDGRASAWDGRLVARLAAPRPETLRRALIRAINTLRGVAMPRVWQCED
ncbi:MAG: urease accessory protein UreD [Pseudomonadota bacterium]